MLPFFLFHSVGNCGMQLVMRFFKERMLLGYVLLEFHYLIPRFRHSATRLSHEVTFVVEQEMSSRLEVILV
jgi:hypothetical protein